MQYERGECVYFATYQQKVMKKIFPAMVIFALATILISCGASRKYGCPMNPQTSYRYR